MRTEIQTFNDGVLSIYSANADGGGNIKLTLKHANLRYEERTVGVERYYKALQENVRITRLLRIPRLRDLSTQDVAVVDGSQHHIRRTVLPQGATPPCWDISLERVEHDYDIERA